MFSAMGKSVIYKGNNCKVVGFAPASAVNCGYGYALLIDVAGTQKYVNTTELTLAE